MANLLGQANRCLAIGLGNAFSLRGNVSAQVQHITMQVCMCVQLCVCVMCSIISINRHQVETLLTVFFVENSHEIRSRFLFFVFEAVSEIC